MPQLAIAFVVRSAQQPRTGTPTLAFQVAGETLTEEDFAKKYTVVSVGGLTTWSSSDPGQHTGEHLVDQAVGLILIEQRNQRKPLKVSETNLGKGLARMAQKPGSFQGTQELAEQLERSRRDAEARGMLKPDPESGKD